jgi:hypothetical protein
MFRFSRATSLRNTTCAAPLLADFSPLAIWREQPAVATSDAAATVTGWMPKPTANLARGAGLFAQQCAVCQSAKGSGDGPSAHPQRPTRAPMRKPQCLSHSIDVLRCDSIFVRRHVSLKFGEVTRAPSMQAGTFEPARKLREIFSWVPRSSGQPCSADFRSQPPRKVGGS